MVCRGYPTARKRAEQQGERPPSAARADARGAAPPPSAARADARGAAPPPSAARADARGAAPPPSAARADARGAAPPPRSAPPQLLLQPTIVGIMDGSQKRAASNANAKRKSSSLDEDFGNDFLVRSEFRKPPRRLALKLAGPPTSSSSDNIIIDAEIKTFSAVSFDDYGGMEILENSKSEITNALMKRYPQLLRKYIPVKAKISPLIDMMMLLKLEMYSLKRQEQNFKAAIDLIVDAFFKHGDKDTLRSCIKAIAFCCNNCQADYAQNKLKNLEDELVLKVKTAIKELEAGDDEYSLLVNLKRLHELQLSKPVKNDGLFEDMYRILSHLREMDNEVKSFLLINMYLEVAWCLHAIAVENPSETSIDGLLSKQSSLFEQLYYFLVVLPTCQKEGRSTTVLSCRTFFFQVCIITAEMWCLFKKSKYSSTRLESLGYLPQLDVVQKFWKLCEQQLNISDETEDEDANEEYIEDTNRDAVMIAAAKLLLADTVSKDYLGPEIVSHYVSHGASTTEIIKHLITALKKNGSIDIAALFFEALRRAYERYMAHVHDGENQNLIGKSYSECQDLANRLAGNYVGFARNKNKSEILKIIQCGISYAFADPPKQLSFLEAALMSFVSKLASSDIPDILTDVQKRAQETNMNEDPSAWRPYFTFVEHLREKHAKNEVLHEEKEEKPVKRRGRPRKVRDEPPPARNLFDGHNSSEEESASDSDQRGHGGDDDDDDDAFDQPLINTFRPSASKLRSLKVSQQGTSSQKNAPGASGSNG